MDIFLNLLRFIISTVMLVCLFIVFIVVVNMPDLPSHFPVVRFCLKYDSIGELTCGDETEVLLGFVKQETERNYEAVTEAYKQDKLNEDVITLKHSFRSYKYNIKPAARLTGSRDSDLMHEVREAIKNSDKNQEDPFHMKTVKLWTKHKYISQEGGFRRYGVAIKNGRIVVPVSGFYEVYSLINFQEECVDGRPKHNSTCPIMHALFKFDISQGEEVKLIESLQPHKVSQHRAVNTYVSYISSTVALKAGDELSLKVNHLSYLRYPEMNYFGAHLI